MASDRMSATPPDDLARLRQWQMLADELNRLNAELEYLKLMLKLDQKLRGPAA